MNEFEKISAREKQFLENFLMTKTGDKRIDSLNFEMDLKLYNFNNKTELKKLFNRYYEKGLPKPVECDHEWVTITDEFTALQEGGKEIKCVKCGETRYVELDSDLGGRIL